MAIQMVQGTAIDLLNSDEFDVFVLPIPFSGDWSNTFNSKMKTEYPEVYRHDQIKGEKSIDERIGKCTLCVSEEIEFIICYSHRYGLLNNKAFRKVMTTIHSKMKEDAYRDKRIAISKESFGCTANWLIVLGILNSVFSDDIVLYIIDPTLE